VCSSVEKLGAQILELRADAAVEDEVPDAGHDAADQLGNKASGLANAASEQAKTFASELERMGRNNPLGALAGALLVGVVIGMIGRGRS